MSDETDLGGAGGEAEDAGGFEFGNEFGGGAETGFDAEDDDVGFDAVGLQRKAVGSFSRFGQDLGVGVVVFEALAVVLQSIERTGGNDTILSHGAAEQFAMAFGFLDRILGAGEGGADGCTEAFAEADTDGVEVLTPFGFGHAGRGDGIPEASAVEMGLQA